jgi:hypothetical protein
MTGRKAKAEKLPFGLISRGLRFSLAIGEESP